MATDFSLPHNSLVTITVIKLTMTTLTQKTGQPALAGTPSSKLEDIVGAKFYCPHALGDSN